MPNEERVARIRSRFRRAAKDKVYSGIHDGRAGRLAADGTPDPNLTADLPPGFLWVRQGSQGERGQVPALRGVSAAYPDAPLKLGYNNRGQLVAFAVDINDETVTAYGDALPAMGVPETPVQLDHAIKDSALINVGRIRPSTNFPNSLYVWIEPFSVGKYELGGFDYNVGSGNIPGTTGQRRWAVVTVGVSNTGQTHNGNAAVIASVNAMQRSDIANIGVTAGHVVVGVVSLSNGQTDINESRFVDAREWLAQRGTMLSDTAETLTLSSGAATAGHGSYFIIAAETGTADDLDTLTITGVPRLIFLQADSGDTITIKHSTGNIELNSAADFALTADKTLALFWDGTNLADIGAGGGAGSGVDVTDGVTTVTGMTSIDFTSGATVTDAGGGVAEIAISGSGSTGSIHIRDKKTQNTPGGTFTSGSWVKRDLNEEVTDTGNHASISSSQITLAAGTYDADIVCPARDCNRHQARLYDTTNTAVLLLGTSAFSSRTGDGDQNYSFIKGRFTLSGSAVLEVQHRCETTSGGTNGLGVEGNFTDEIYTVVILTRA
jgi:hypothetical protein